MEIKDFSKVTVRGDMLLCEVFEKKSKSGLILPDTMDNSTSIEKMVVIAKGKNIDDVEIGDIVINVDGGLAIFELGDRKWAIVARHLCPIITKEDNLE